MNKSPRILFFIDNAKPSELEQAEATMLGNNVAFRNAQLVLPEECVEKCDGVVGCVPEKYKGYANGEEIMKTIETKQKSVLKEAKDRVAAAKKAQSTQSKESEKE